MLWKTIKRLNSRRWELAFINEDMESILEGKPITFTKVRNPFAKEYWFADPFILDVTPEYVYLLVEAMLAATHKGVIAKLTIARDSLTITDVDVVLEEPWHLSFPNITRKNGHVYVIPESALSHQLSLYELMTENGKDKLIKVATLCDDVVWDSEITDFFGEPIMFTAHQDDFHLDIYVWDADKKRYIFHETLESDSQNMRMAGSFFKHNDAIFCPSQVSTPYVYGKAVEIREFRRKNGQWKISPARTINPPRGLLIRGLHTFNNYKGMTIVDINSFDHLAGLFVEKMVNLKKKFWR